MFVQITHAIWTHNMLKFLTVQSFVKFSYSLFWNTDIVRERGRPVQKWDQII